MLNNRFSLVVILVAIMAVFVMWMPIKTKSYLYKWIVNPEILVDSAGISNKNKLVLLTAEKYGKAISPTYEQAVCTEFVIGVLDKLEKITKATKQQVRIITNESLDSLYRSDARILKGVVCALEDAKLGEEISLNEAKAGDFFQFWDYYNGQIFGHCGILRGFDNNKVLMSAYSSAPSTNGFGIQTYVVPEKIFFVRLRP